MGKSPFFLLYQEQNYKKRAAAKFAAALYLFLAE